MSISVRIILICIVLGLCVLFFIIRALRDKEDNPGIIKKTIKFVVIFTITVFFIILLFTQVFLINVVPSGSMEPTIMAGDIIFSARYGLQTINRYDVIVFKEPDDESVLYVKRVIGLPGETIEIKDGNVYADGILLQDSFINEQMNDIGNGIYVVPENEYFMLGDNRNESNDSRFWEYKYVTQDELMAKVLAVVLPLSDIKNI